MNPGDVHLYADDVQFYVSKPLCQVNDCISMCNTLLFINYNWANENGLCLIPKKSKCIVIYKKPFDTTQLPNLMIGNSPLKYE